MSGAYQNPTEFFILLAPAVSLFLVLSSRQARISTIARENTAKLLSTAADLESAHDDLRKCRIENLCSQNHLLFSRYRIIQWALLVICMALVVLGIVAFYTYFKTSLPLLVAGIMAMGLGTIVVLYEIGRAADTLWLELAFCEWIRKGKSSERPDQIKSWTIFRRLPDH